LARQSTARGRARRTGARGGPPLGLPFPGWSSNRGRSVFGIAWQEKDRGDLASRGGQSWRGAGGWGAAGRVSFRGGGGRGGRDRGGKSQRGRRRLSTGAVTFPRAPAKRRAPRLAYAAMEHRRAEGSAPRARGAGRPFRKEMGLAGRAVISTATNLVAEERRFEDGKERASFLCRSAIRRRWPSAVGRRLLGDRAVGRASGRGTPGRRTQEHFTDRGNMLDRCRGDSSVESLGATCG